MTVRLTEDLGMPLVVEYSKRFGVYDDLLPVLAMSLGSGETTLLRMTAAYAMLANGGKQIKPTLIDRIQDRWGKTVWRHDERSVRNARPAIRASSRTSRMRASKSSIRTQHSR